MDNSLILILYMYIFQSWPSSEKSDKIWKQRVTKTQNCLIFHSYEWKVEINYKLCWDMINTLLRALIGHMGEGPLYTKVNEIFAYKMITNIRFDWINWVVECGENSCQKYGSLYPFSVISPIFCSPRKGHKAWNPRIWWVCFLTWK